MSVSNWINHGPKNYFPKCIKMFGKSVYVANVKNGAAFWKTRGLFSEHLLRDEYVSHCVPRNHHDYFYSSVYFYIPKDKLLNVLRISGSIGYDGLKKYLTARCASIEANMATIYLGMLVASGKASIKDVKKNDMYARMIRGEILPHNEMRKKMIELKKSNNKKYSKELKLEYATYAFDKCYSEPKNDRKESCSAKGWTTCCPYKGVNPKGKYIATNETNILEYKGKSYKLKTCCNNCACKMIEEAKKRPLQFKNKYIEGFEKDGTMILKNKHTGVVVQKAKLM